MWSWCVDILGNSYLVSWQVQLSYNIGFIAKSMGGDLQMRLGGSSTPQEWVSRQSKRLQVKAVGTCTFSIPTFCSRNYMVIFFMLQIFWSINGFRYWLIFSCRNVVLFSIHICISCRIIQVLAYSWLAVTSKSKLYKLSQFKCFTKKLHWWSSH